jgi:hypothetical protein
MSRLLLGSGLLLLGLVAVSAESGRTGAKLPKLPGKAPVFAVITQVNEAEETFGYILLYDEVINTKTRVVDNTGKTLEQSSDSVMTNRFEEQVDRSFRGTVVSTGAGEMIPAERVWRELAGKIVIFCDDFDGLHPVFRRMLADDTWIIEPKKPQGLRKDDSR